MINFLLYIIVFLCLFFVLIEFIRLFEKKSNRFDIYFGSVGSGKSTYASKLAYQYQKKGIKVLSNFNIKGCKEFDYKDLGTFNITDCLIIIDEAGIDFDNRNFKDNFTKSMVRFFKTHRHYNVDIVVFSQDWEDMDKKLRKLATKLYEIKKSYFPFTFKRRQIKKYIGINEMDGQIQELYEYIPFSSRYTLGFKYWKLFDSYERVELPNKDFINW